MLEMQSQISIFSPSFCYVELYVGSKHGKYGLSGLLSILTFLSSVTSYLFQIGPQSKNQKNMVFYSVIFMLLPYYSLHRIVEVVGGSWRYLAQPLAQNNQLEQVAPNIVQLRFDSLQRWILCNVSGQHVPVLGHAHGKKGFLFCLSNCELIHNLFLSLMHIFVFTRKKR